MAIQATQGLMCLVFNRSFAKALAPCSGMRPAGRFYQSDLAKAILSTRGACIDLLLAGTTGRPPLAGAARRISRMSRAPASATPRPEDFSSSCFKDVSMSDPDLYPVPSEWSQRARMTKSGYEAARTAARETPDAFWAEQAAASTG